MTSDLLLELANIGYRVSSLEELRKSGRRYRDAVPTLLNALEQCDDLNMRQDVVRTLTVPWAREAAFRPILDEFRSAQERWGPAGAGLAWAAGNALEVLADDSVFDEMSKLATDKGYGRARQMVVLWFRKSKRSDALLVLLSLVDDPDVDGHAIMALSRSKAAATGEPIRDKLRQAFEHKVDDHRAWVRREARKALGRLDVA